MKTLQSVQVNNLLRKSVVPRWEEAQNQLMEREPRFGDLINRFPGEVLSGKGDPFQTLANAIVGQQISVKAAESIWNRLKASVHQVAPEEILALNGEELRSLGLSGRKAIYLQNLARAFAQGMVVPELWPEKDDDEVVAELTALKGIGRWTAEMFLIFHLNRPDVLPVDDIGLLKAAGLFFGEPGKMDPKRLSVLAEPWQPWRTVATWYLWRSLDPVPVAY